MSMLHCPPRIPLTANDSIPTTFITTTHCKRHGSPNNQRTCFGNYIFHVLASKHNQHAPLRW